MPVYFFNTRSEGTFEEDTDGANFPDMEAARLEAIRAAREMMIEQIALGEPVTEQVFEVCDEFGNLLFKLAFNDVLHS